MKCKFSISALILLLSSSVFAADSYYCPQHSATIKIGMTMDQVLSACGDPISKQESNEPVYKKIPVQELIYNNMGTDTAFFDYWNIPTGSGGAQMQVSIVDNKIKEITINGGTNNASTICPDANIQVGDNVGAVYTACGSPSIVNNTYVNVPIESEDPPQVWIYKPSQYVDPVSLTFVEGTLKSIN